MRKLYLLTALICTLCVTLSAQRKDFFNDKKHELRLSIGSVNDDGYYNKYYYGGYYNYYGYSYGYGSVYGYGFGDYYAAENYSGPTKTLGVLGLSYFYHLPNTRFSFGATTSYNAFNTNYYKRSANTKIGYFKEYNLAFTPSVRYAWITKDWFQLYSGVGVSLYLHITRYKLDEKKEDSSYDLRDTNFLQNIQVTPLGFSVGKTIFGFGEVNIGGRAGTVVGGIGYRF